MKRESLTKIEREATSKYALDHAYQEFDKKPAAL